MLTNSLSLDEEEAVQRELRSLQQETVSSWCLILKQPGHQPLINPPHRQLRAQGNAETTFFLPDAPITEPVSSEQGKPFCIHQPCY